MHTFFSIFTRPFPLEENRKVQFLHSAIASGLAVLFIFLFQPFGLADVILPVFKIIPVYAGYGVVTLIVCLITYRIIRPAFPSFFDDQKWNVAKHLVWLLFLIMLIGFGNLFYSRMLGFTGISGSSLLSFQFTLLAVSVIPVTVVTILRMFRLSALNLKQAAAINENLGAPIKTVNPDTYLLFVSDDGKDVMKLPVDQFLYAESADNYTDVVYIEKGIVRRALIRSSLKKIEDMNTADFVIRVHRVFLVNMRKVKSVMGNPQGFRLVFDSIDETIPVARRNAQHVKELLMRLHSS